MGAKARTRSDAMTTLARLVAVFGIAFIVLFAITGSWYYALLAFFALAIVLPAAWTRARVR
jgi:hypothetical protein